MHFVIEGASGASLGHLCHDSTTIGEIHYGNVKDYSFVYVTV